jgi:AP-3 complex subunit beta
MMTKGRDMHDYFPAIVKLVSTRSFELRRLVYMYILRYAEQEQELALLSINSFQRDVYDDSPIIRAMALRVLSGIRIKVVAHIVALAIEKCAVDESSYVRKAAALAIPKLIHVDQGQLERMGEVIKVLLGDRSALTLGSTVVAFNEVCRERMDIVHPFYHRLCFALMDADEWSQCALLDLLMRYARRCFVDPTTKVRRGGRNGVQVDVRHFYSSEESDDEEEVGDVLDADHELLLSKAEPLLESRNAGVGLNIVDDVVVGGDGSSCPIRPRWHAWRPKADSWSHAAHPATVHTRHSTTCAEQHQGTRGAAPLYRMFLQPNKYL